jgi:hypothetical protein
VEARARAGWRWLAIAVLVTAPLLGAALVALARRELGLVETLLVGDARWDLPGFVGRVRTLWLGREATWAAGLALAFAAVLYHRRVDPGLRKAAPVRPSALAMAAALAALASAIALPWIEVDDGQALGFRMRIAAFVPMALLAAAVLGSYATLLPSRARTPALAAVAALWVALQPPVRGDGAIFTHPALAVSMEALAAELPDDAVIVCPERHILFMTAWYTRRPGRLRPERVPRDRRWRLLPGAFIGAGSELDRLLLEARGVPELVPPRGLHPRAANGHVILPEATWEWVLERLPADDRRRMLRWPTI